MWGQGSKVLEKCIKYPNVKTEYFGSDDDEETFPCFKVRMDI
jgi:hypothetical protein